MNTIKSLLIICTVALMTSCATTVKFPVSNIVPAADISAKKTTDNNNNFMLELTALNLAGAERLSPSGNNYSVWVVTKEGDIKNVGQITVRNAKKSTFKTTTPFDFNEVFITVENQGDLMVPTGTEISRIKI